MSAKNDEPGSLVVPAVVLMISVILLILSLFCASGCTLNMIMTHTEGNASDVVDSNPSTKADVSPDISVPLVP